MTKLYADMTRFDGRVAVLFGNRFALDTAPDREFLTSEERSKPNLTIGDEVILVAKGNEAFYVHDVKGGKGQFVGNKKTSIRGEGPMLIGMVHVALLGIGVWGLTVYEAKTGNPIPVVSPAFALFTLMACLAGCLLIFVSGVLKGRERFLREFDIPTSK